MRNEEKLVEGIEQDKIDMERAPTLFWLHPQRGGLGVKLATVADVRVPSGLPTSSWDTLVHRAFWKKLPFWNRVCRLNGGSSGYGCQKLSWQEKIKKVEPGKRDWSG